MRMCGYTHIFRVKTDVTQRFVCYKAYILLSIFCFKNISKLPIKWEWEVCMSDDLTLKRNWLTNFSIHTQHTQYPPTTGTRQRLPMITHS